MEELREERNIAETAAEEAEEQTCSAGENAAAEDLACDESTAETADLPEDDSKADDGNDSVDDSDKEPRRRFRGFRYVAAFAAGFAACLAVFAIALYAADLGRIIPAADYEYYEDISNKYGKYYIIMEMIGEDPLVDVSPAELTDASIKEIIDGLDDPYAEYYTKEEFEEFSRTFEGNYVGVGIVVEQTEDAIVVDSVFEDGPAAKAGMEPGDKILRVDGVKPESLDEAVSRMKGEEDTEVTVTVDRDGKEIDLKMIRKPIDMDSVGYMVTEEDPEVGYIAITLFAEDTEEEFEKAVEELKELGCDKFILDLRNNGGGLTNTSIGIADYLLPECRIMTEVTKDGTEKEYNSEESSADLDMVVLVNENTASASEILTAAISENGGGTVIGTKTFGKGVTQVTRQFSDGSAVKITYSEYLTPKGHHVQEKGITPDIEASNDDIMEKAFEELSD